METSLTVLFNHKLVTSHSNMISDTNHSEWHIVISYLTQHKVQDQIVQIIKFFSLKLFL